MYTKISSFDRIVTSYVAYIPKNFETPFRWLGRCTTPILWASYVAVAQYVWFSDGYLGDTALLVIIFLPLASILKLFFRRKRPATIYADNMRIKSYSFPSSHAYSATLAGGYLAVSSMATGITLIAVIMTAIVIAIAVSRIRIGAHYPSDVLAGIVLGACVLWVLVST